MLRLFSILLLFAFIFPFFGTYIALHQTRIVRREVNRRISRGVKQDELTHFEFNTADASKTLIWKNENEFEYNHLMYDVVNRTERNGKLHLWCLPDNKESKLKLQFDSMVKNTFDTSCQSTKAQMHFFNFLPCLFFDDHKVSTLADCASTQNYFTYTSNQFKLYSPPPFTPPPQRA